MVGQARNIGEPLHFTANIDAAINPDSVGIARHAADVFSYAIGTLATDPSDNPLLTVNISNYLERGSQETEECFQERLMLERVRAKRMQEFGITPREQQIAELIAQGATNPQISKTLALSEGTVRTYIGRMLERIGSEHRSHIVTVLILGYDSPKQKSVFSSPNNIANARTDGPIIAPPEVHPLDSDAPGSQQVHEITLRAIVSPEYAEATCAETIAFAKCIGALTIGDPEIKVTVRSKDIDQAAKLHEETESMLAILGERMTNAGLSDIERAVCRLMFLGFDRREIAGKLYRSESRINNYVGAVHRKVGSKNRFELVCYLIGVNRTESKETLISEATAEAEVKSDAAPEQIEAPNSPLTNEERQHLITITERMMGHYKFSADERDVAILVIRGKSDAAISAELYMSSSSVKDHLTRIYNKLGIRKRAYIADALLGNFFSSLNKSDV